MSAAVSDLGVGLEVGTYNTSGRNACRPITTVKFRTRTRMDSKEKKKMTKTHKAVLSTLAVLCLLFMGSGVAQAQQCIARAISPGTVRAEGITEVVANIELKCRPPEETFGFNEVPERLDIAIELNARITNGISETRFVEVTEDGGVRGYKSREIDLRAFDLLGDTGVITTMPISDAAFLGVSANGLEMGNGGKLSEDSKTIVWANIATGQDLDDPDPAAFAIPEDTLNLGVGADQDGFSLLIVGLRVNASSVGAGEDITAVVMVKGSAVGNPIKVADVATGLAIKAEAGSGLQCADSNEDAVATITIQEGYAAGIMAGIQAMAAIVASEAGVTPEIAAVPAVVGVDGDTVLVSFRGIPEGVSVMVPDAVGLAPDKGDTTANEMTESFRLALVSDGRDTGIDGKVADGKAKVMLSAAGNGSVVYQIFDASNDVDANEWANLPVTFQWTAGGDMPAIGSSYVNVSFNPVSAIGGDTFPDSNAQTPRFIATSGDPIMVLEIGDCTTTLLFPFVTNQHTFDTGLVISNTSEEAGSCTITYSGANAPEPQSTQAVAGGAQWINLASAISPGFQGYLTAACGFREAFGFAFLTNGFGVGETTAAQGYLAVCMAGTSCD